MVSIDQVIVLFIVFVVLFVTFGIYYCFMCVNCVLWNYMQLEPKLVGISMDGLVQLWCSVLTRNVTWVMGQITVIDWNLRINSLKLHNWWNCYVARLCQIIHILCFTISFWNQYIYCQPKLLEWWLAGPIPNFCCCFLGTDQKSKLATTTEYGYTKEFL
jgi:hypothetical protein